MRQSGGRNIGAWHAGRRTSLHCGRRFGERTRRDQHPQTSHAQRTTHEVAGATGSHEGAAAAGAGHRKSLPTAQHHPDQHHRCRHPRHRRHLHPHCRCLRRLHLHHCHRSPHSRHHPHLHPHPLHRHHRRHRRPRHTLQHPCPPCSCRCGTSH
ncbi:unnamed protein product [Closterium sp. NIES-53]